MVPHIPERADWSSLFARMRDVAGEAFDGDKLSNLIADRWWSTGEPTALTSPNDGRVLARLSKIDADTAEDAVRRAATAHRTWSGEPFEKRKARVSAALARLGEVRDDIALSLVWEIGKPWKLACADIDRCLSGVAWYVENAAEMLATDANGEPFERRALPGPVSNIASWNYPFSVLVHAELVQLLAGNAVVAKTPTQGGAISLTLAHALMAREGLPVTLLSGNGAELSGALVRSPEIGALAFVGGRTNGGKIAAMLVDTGKRHMLEQEGLNAWGIWRFSDWDTLATHIRKGFEYGKQRCTAYPRFVVQRELMDDFLDTYLSTVRSVRFGHPLAVDDEGEEFPALDYGPLISADKAIELDGRVREALRHGAIPLYRGGLDAGRFLPDQDVSAYHAPVALLAPPGASRLMHEEPFGPVDTIVVVDTEAELLAQMNVSNGALVSSIACDDEQEARRLAADVQAFKVGINKPRSRGDKGEPFGGIGGSWQGAFVGGQYLVQAVSQGPAGEQLYGNFPGSVRKPPA